MCLLAYIHTFNDEDVIDRSLKAVSSQTHAVSEILIVDNASTDDTLQRDFPPGVTIIHHGHNLGTAGAVISGFQYALERDYEWIWILDADSVPRPDALENLLGLYETFPPEIQAQTRLIASLLIDSVTGAPYHGTVFDREGSHTVVPEPGSDYYELDAALWSGCLFRLDAVRRLGLPRADYVIDRDDFAYGYRGKQAGLKAFLNLKSVVDHNVGGEGSLKTTGRRLGIPTFELSALRCYYVIRNTLYFWLYEFEEGSFALALRKLAKVTAFSLNFLLRPRGHGPQIVACMRGMRDGLTRRIERRY
jgi:GT2 family glycosyltransferase